MRIRAVRLADVGQFRRPVALEGLSGRLDVLAGPNEIGKSTIFRAIEAGLCLKHTSEKLGGLLPRGGGEPTIEIDFETAGRLWRIHKRFGHSARARTAGLLDLTTGRLEARGTASDDRLQELTGLGGKTNGRFGLLFVGQDTAALHRKLLPEEHSLLMSAIEAEVAAVAGGAELSRVRRRVCALLDEQTTPADRNRPRVRSAFAQALAAVQHLEGALATARLREQETAAALDRLATMKERRLAQFGAEAQAALAAKARDMRSRLDGARAAHAMHAEALRRAAEARHAQSLCQEFDRRLEELRATEAEATRHVAAATDLDRQSRAASAGLQQATADLAGLDDDLQVANERLARRIAADAAAEAAVARARRSSVIDETLAAARGLQAQIASLTGEIASAGVTRETLAAIERQQAEIGILETRLAAARPTVEVAYEAGAEGRITLGGKPLPGGMIRAEGVLVLNIPGIGSIRITPGDNADLAADADDLEARRATLAALLASSGSADAATARAKLHSRQELERAKAEAEARLRGLAPAGVGSLETERAELARAREPAAVELPSRGDLEATLADVRLRHVAARRAEEAASRAASEVAARLEAARAAVAVLADRRSALEAALPAPAVRDGERRRLAETAESAHQKADEAFRAARTLQAEPASEREVADLAVAGELAEAALARYLAEEQELARAIERVEGELDESLRTGGGRRAAEIEGELQSARTECDRIGQEVAALRLLETEIDAVEREGRAQYMRPVLDRLQPYLEAVLPSATLALGAKLEPSALSRDGDPEDVTSLSGGTREQVAVLVRLAFARLLADTGAAAPLILDDALVYSDDERIGRMMRVLHDAADHHQVIVLTCRTRSFEDWNGPKLALTPWVRAQTEAA